MAVEDPIAYRYVEDKNPEHGTLPGGVPLRDLTVSDMEGMPEWLQQTVQAHPMYRATGKFKPAPVEASATEPPAPPEQPKTNE